MTAEHALDAAQRVVLLEACRAKDRLDCLATGAWPTVQSGQLSSSAFAATLTAQSLKQLLAGLRLPDEWGRRPQRRGVPRGVYV